MQFPDAKYVICNKQVLFCCEAAKESMRELGSCLRKGPKHVWWRLGRKNSCWYQWLWTDRQAGHKSYLKPARRRVGGSKWPFPWQPLHGLHVSRLSNICIFNSQVLNGEKSLVKSELLYTHRRAHSHLYLSHAGFGMTPFTAASTGLWRETRSYTSTEKSSLLFRLWIPPKSRGVK